MPALAAAIGPVAGLIGGSGFGALLTNALIGTAINFAIGAVIDWIEPDQPANDNARPTGVELQFRSGSKVAVSAIMGTKDTPGQLAYHNSYGPDNEFLQLLFIDGNGEHAGIYSLLFDNAAVSLSGSNADPHGFTIDKFTVDANNVEDPGGTPHAWVKFYTGAAGQAADPQLVARANPVGRWTSECTLTATAYRIVTLRYNPKLFGGAIPQMRAVWRGLKLYDRRKDSTQPGGSGPHRWGQPETYEWTENPAICQDNWRRGIWINGVRLLGLGVSEHDCYHAGIVAAANVSDEALHYADTDVTLPRYTLGIEVKDGTDPISMMRLFESAMAGYGAEYGGAYTPLPAQTMASVLTLTDRHRVAGEDVLEQTRMSPTETKTAFHGQFNNPAIGWLPDDYDIRFNAVAESQEGGRRAEPFDATFVWYRETASMLAEIKVRRDRYSALEVATFGPRAADLRPGQVITRESELLGTVQMMVLGVQRQPRKRYRLSLRSWNNAIVPTPGGGFMPLPVDPLPAPVPVRLTHPMAPLAVAISQVSGDNEVPAIRFTFTPITDPTVDRVIVKYWPTAHPTDVRYASSDEPGSGIMVIEGVAPVTEYRLVATIVTTPARPTTWTNEVVVTTTSYVFPTGPAELSEELNDARSWAARSIEEIMADTDAMIAHMGDASLGGAVDRQTLRTEITARFQSTEAEITAAYTSAVNVVASNLGALVSRTELLEATVNNPTTGVAATATALSALTTSVNAQFEATASAIIAVEASIGLVMAGGYISIQAVAAPSGWDVRAAFAIKGSSGGGFTQVGLYMDAKADGTSRIFLDADEVVYTGRQRSVNGLSYWDMDTGEFVSEGDFSFG